MSNDATPRPFDPAAERGILVVLPHPDDESFSTGGTLARAAAAGVPATYLCGTYGDMGRRMGKPAFTNREALRDVRTKELQDACAVLGCNLKYMGLRDKCIEFEDPAEVAAQVRAVILELNPSTVITFYPGHGVHPDHDALGHATVLAVRGLPKGERPQLLASAIGERDEILAELGPHHVACDIEAYAPKKLDALRAHRSQTEVMFAQWDEERLGTGAGPVNTNDDQAKAFRDQFTKSERFYVIDPDAPTLIEQRA
jgi:bacillithiol biosynthesis deacetylase BshB2